MTHSEANEILNRFQGWEPGRKCDGDKGCAEPSHHVIGSDERLKHMSNDIPPIDYFADETPELWWQIKLLKDEFVRRICNNIEPITWLNEYGELRYRVRDYTKGVSLAIESHAVALAIAKAIKEQVK